MVSITQKQAFFICNKDLQCGIVKGNHINQEKGCFKS